MKEKIKNGILPCILIFLAVIATMNLPIIQNGDELWTFANTYKLYNGISLYNENNIIVTPLFFWIGNLIFKVLGATFFTYRIYNIILTFSLYAVVYRILKTCKIKKEIAIIITIALMFMLFVINKVGADYTVLALIYFYIGVLNLLKNIDKKANIIFQGIILFAIFMTKQNVAVYYGIALFAYLLSKPQKIKNILLLGMTTIIPVILFLGYEFAIGEFYNFINYTVLGIKEFAQNNIIVEDKLYTQTGIAIQISAILIGSIQIRDDKIKNKKDEILKILFIFSVANIMLGYPIFNLYHVSTGIIIPIIMIIYLVYNYVSNAQISEKLKNKLNISITNIIAIITIALVILAAKFLYKSHELLNSSKFSKEDPFFGGVITKEEPEYDEVINFIKQKEEDGEKVIIFDIRANLYMVPLKKNNQNYDLPMLGNWGKNGENVVLEDIKNKQNTYFLTYEETRRITTQESKKIKEYMKENFINKGTIGKYNIYYKE